jgi:hypothetical protein
MADSRHHRKRISRFAPGSPRAKGLRLRRLSPSGFLRRLRGSPKPKPVRVQVLVLAVPVAMPPAGCPKRAITHYTAGPRRLNWQLLVRSAFQSIMGAYEGAFSAEPAAGGHPRGGLGRPGEPVVGSPTHPVMSNLVVLWEISPLRGGVRAGARLWAWGPARRSWVATRGPNRSPGGLVGPQARCGGGRGGQPGLLIWPYNIRG